MLPSIFPFVYFVFFESAVKSSFSLTAPIWLALRQISLNSFCEIGTTVDTGHHIVECDGLFCCIQAPLCLLDRPDGERGKRTNLLCNPDYVRHEHLFLDKRRKKTTLHRVGRCKQAP